MMIVYKTFQNFGIFFTSPLQSSLLGIVEQLIYKMKLCQLNYQKQKLNVSCFHTKISKLHYHLPIQFGKGVKIFIWYAFRTYTSKIYLVPCIVQVKYKCITLIAMHNVDFDAYRHKYIIVFTCILCLLSLWITLMLCHLCDLQRCIKSIFKILKVQN